MGADAWQGDLTRFSTRAWVDDSDLAAMVVVRGDHATLYINRRLIPSSCVRLVEAWGHLAAYRRPPCDVLYADDLASLAVITSAKTA